MITFPDFAATVNTDDYHVFLTEHDNNNGLYGIVNLNWPRCDGRIWPRLESVELSGRDGYPQKMAVGSPSSSARRSSIRGEGSSRS
jgi:hypothetical protein